MIMNIIFDIGNVIYNFDIERVIGSITEDEEEKKFIYNNIFLSPEWTGYNLIDTGLITKDAIIKIQCDRTNHYNDELIYRFWYTYNEYGYVDNRMLELIKKLKKDYKIYLLSNMNEYTSSYIEKSGLYDIVDGYILSYQVNQIKPYVGIYNSLINKYGLNVNETMFIDDNKKNIDTSIKLGIKGKNVEADNYFSVLNALEEEGINV